MKYSAYLMALKPTRIFRVLQDHHNDRGNRLTGLAFLLIGAATCCNGFQRLSKGIELK